MSMTINPSVNRSRTLSLFAVLFFVASSAPVTAQNSQAWYKGNLHTHSLWSDGNDFPEMIADWYRQNDYDFLTLSDHNVLSRGEKWISSELPQSRGAIQALKRYEQRFGEDWVETRKAGETGIEVRLKTLEEFRSKVEEPGEFLLMQAEEITDHFGSLPIHINATNLAELIRPQGGESVVQTIDNNLKAVEAQRVKLGRPMIAHLNHPNFGYGVSVTDLSAATREHFFEVFNGHPSVNQPGDDTHMSVEEMWDVANTLRLAHFSSRPLYGVATDDSHHYFSEQGAISGRGWVQVRAESLKPDRLILAMEAGDFYASTGVELSKVHWNEATNELSIEVDAEEGVDYTIQFVGTRLEHGEAFAKAFAIDQKLDGVPPGVGAILSEAKGPTASYRLEGDELYVRAIVQSTKGVARPVWKDQKAQAWTQPVGWKSSE